MLIELVYITVALTVWVISNVLATFNIIDAKTSLTITGLTLFVFIIVIPLAFEMFCKWELKNDKKNKNNLRKGKQTN